MHIVKKANDFHTSIHHAKEGLSRKETYDHYTNEWERLNRLAKLAESAKENPDTIQNIYLLMDDVTMILEEFIA